MTLSCLPVDSPWYIYSEVERFGCRNASWARIKAAMPKNSYIGYLTAGMSSACLSRWSKWGKCSCIALRAEMEQREEAKMHNTPHYFATSAIFSSDSGITL